MIHQKSTVSAFAVGLISLFVMGCIPVKNVENGWNANKADDALAGSWVGKSDNEKRIGFIKTDKDFLVTSSTSGLEGGCRSFETNGHKYVVVVDLKPAVLGFDHVDAASKNGTLLRYKIEDDTLTMYMYDADELKNAVKGGKVKGELDENESATLTELDDATIKWLGTITEGPGWNAEVYKRSK